MNVVSQPRDKLGRFRKKSSSSSLSSQLPKRQTKRKTPKPKKASVEDTFIVEKNKQKNKKKLKLKTNKLKTKLKPKEKPLTITSNTLPIAYGHVYSDQCGHCINMQSDWDKLKNNIGNKCELYDIGEDHSNQVRKFNSRFHSSLNFDGFPTVFKLQKHGDSINYYDTYYQQQKDLFDKNMIQKEPFPYRSYDSMRLWLRGG